MKRDVAEGYRRDVEALIELQDGVLPLCRYDGEPCPHNLGCQVSAFGVLASDGVEEVIWTCPRFKEVSPKSK